ncbi:DUF4381 domain-containing protein [Alteromonas sp. ASW11-19]|uniref:DUF4381 domain-containing protein n=1 Tax=Alteromonas salexigens TaxID=2982530 RepID=A0ABT2VPF0_9ALTE|nr:DUF4381 domain-containing protein [Alteromonas salexigens]MCU7555169.1 DUF4381 domain-containing protein [Alteromonas salexigens]
MMQGMPTQDPLAQLRDIHTPDPVSAWPLAWGWWCVIALVLMLVSFGVYRYVKHRRRQRPRREALRQLSAVSARDDDWPTQLNGLMKRVALVYYPSSEVAALYGEQWQQFLLKTLPARKASQAQGGLQQLNAQRYQPTTADATAFDDAVAGVRVWLRHARLPKQQERDNV